MKQSLDVEHLTQVLQTTAELTHEIASLAQVEDDAWAIEWADGAQMLIEWADEPPRLVLSSDLGSAPSASKSLVQTAALSYNALWRDTGGTRLAQAGDTGELILIHDLAVDDLKPGPLGDQLSQFAAVATWWSTFVSHPATADDGALPQFPAPLFLKV